MEQDRHWIKFLGRVVEVIYDDDGVYMLDDASWDFFVDNNNCIQVSIYGHQSIDAIRNVLELAEWCEEGLQWNA